MFVTHAAGALPRVKMVPIPSVPTQCRHSWIASSLRGGKNLPLRVEEREDQIPSWEAANHLFDKQVKDFATPF